MNIQIDTASDENDWGDESNRVEDAWDDNDMTPLPPLLQEKCHKEPASLSSSGKSIYFEMPPQLHPACSAGVRRVSSCYFSLGSLNDNQSVTDILSQTGANKTDKENEDDPACSAGVRRVPSSYFSLASLNDNQSVTDILSQTGANKTDKENEDEADNDSVEFFYHDILMQIFTFLDPKSLLFFSETSRRSNFEVFYFLQLHLQQALLLDDDIGNCAAVNYNTSTFESSASILSRVARLDMGKARELLEEYQDSNSTLRTMPLSYSLAYVQHYLSRKGIHKIFTSSRTRGDSRNIRSSKKTSSQTLASAAIFVTVAGAASLVSSSDSPMNLLSVGFVGILGAISDPESGSAVREKAEQMARSMQELPAAFIAKRRKLEQQQHSKVEEGINDRMNFVLPSLYEMRDMLQEMMSIGSIVKKNDKQQPLLFDPYGHLPSHQGPHNKKRETVDAEEKDIYSHDYSDEQQTMPQTTSPIDVTTKTSTTGLRVPSGCIGAFSRVINKAAEYVTSEIKAERKSNFESLPSEDQRLQSLEFLSVCSSNDTLDRVKEMALVMDVDRFYIGNDGNETCALHTAAFNGADQVVEFLCAGISSKDSRLDGGLCDVNAKDNNGWTALHFAAGANSVAAIRVLANHGAKLNVEAQNGYSPLTWAVRLSNDGVTEELKVLIERADAEQIGTWMSSEHLASIANHFLSLIPSENN